MGLARYELGRGRMDVKEDSSSELHKGLNFRLVLCASLQRCQSAGPELN